VTSAIVVEGGAMRGIFAAGVLDVLHERGVSDFDLAIGASAGACNLASHLAGQHGRNRRCYLTQMRRPEFIDARRFLRGGHWLDLDYLWEAFDREDPLDVTAAASHRTQLVVAATSVETGHAEFFAPTADRLNETLRASSAVPVLFRRFVELDGRHYTDGGVSAPVPVEEAYRRGARRIFVIRSRPVGFEGPSRVESAVAAMMLRNQPNLARAFARYRRIYERARQFLRSPPRDCQIVHVAPDVLHTSRTTQDGAVLERDYQRGRRAAERAIIAWQRPPTE
jgi:predicted patatin/cPLA2 family phospholipase